MIELRDGSNDFSKLERITRTLLADAGSQSGLQRLNTSFRAGVPQLLNHSCIVIKLLVCVRRGSPGSGISAHRQQIFGSVWNAVQRTTIFTSGNLFFRSVGLLQRQLRRQGGVGIQPRAKLAAAFKIAFRKLHWRKTLQPYPA